MNTTDYIFIDFPIRNYLYGTNVKEVYIRKPLSKLMRFFRKLPVFSKFISNTKEIKNWSANCKNAKNVVLFDTYAHYTKYCKEIELAAPKNSRLILYLLNPAFFSEEYRQLSSRWEVWTFMEEDAKKLGFKYGATFYNPQLKSITMTGKKSNHINKDTEEQKLLFIGTDKGRKTFLLSLKEKLKPLGIKCDFRIVDNFKSLYNKDFSREVDYFTLCHLTQHAYALLDVVQQKQSGLTLRFMEGLLFDKKVITTNQSINENPDFGNNPDIYILTSNNINELNAFLRKATTPYPLWLKEKYSFPKWLERLDKNIEAK